MRIARHIGLVVVLAVGLIASTASWSQAESAKVQAATCPTYVQWYTPAGSWNVPATAGAGAPAASATLCTTYVPQTVQACPPQVVAPPDTLWGVVGSVLALPFEVGRCVIAGCP